MAEVALDLPWRVDRGPGWLIVRFDPSISQRERCDELAAGLWNLLEQHFTYRIVLEFDEVDQLPSKLLGEIAWLHERVAQQGGVVRLCGLRPQCQRTLNQYVLQAKLPTYRDRCEAVLGPRPSQPR